MDIYSREITDSMDTAEKTDSESRAKDPAKEASGESGNDSGAGREDEDTTESETGTEPENAPEPEAGREDEDAPKSEAGREHEDTSDSEAEKGDEDEPESDGNDSEAGRRGKTGRWLLIAAGVFTGLTALIYAAGVFFFTGHYYWQTEIDGKDYSFRSREQAREEILDPAITYELKITGREDMEDVIIPAELGMRYVFDDTLDQMAAGMTGLKWPTMLFTKNSCELPRIVIYDEGKLEKRLRASPFFQGGNVHWPEDAVIGEYVSGEGYSIQKEYPGTVLNFERVKLAVEKALEDLQMTLDLTEGTYYSDANVTSENKKLVRALNQANRYVSACITYHWNGAEEVIDGDLISEWVHIDGMEVSLDEEAVREYVKNLARKHDTYGRDRHFTTTAGDTILLRSGGYGWWTDRAGEAEALIESIRNGEKLEKEPLYFMKGYAEGAPGEDIGTSYVEADLGKQHLYLYMEGKLVLESDFVSGSMSRGRGTPAGVFGLTYKTRDTTLTGANYASHVDYWMPFNGNIGMHDASWRRSFGGNIYLSNGSHGCINLPVEAARQIYEYVEKGFPVICYY